MPMMRSMTAWCRWGGVGSSKGAGRGDANVSARVVAAAAPSWSWAARASAAAGGVVVPWVMSVGSRRATTSFCLRRGNRAEALKMHARQAGFLPRHGTLAQAPVGGLRRWLHTTQSARATRGRARCNVQRPVGDSAPEPSPTRHWRHAPVTGMMRPLTGSTLLLRNRFFSSCCAGWLAAPHAGSWGTMRRPRLPRAGDATAMAMARQAPAQCREAPAGGPYYSTRLRGMGAARP